jgi:hypothetical protein
VIYGRDAQPGPDLVQSYVAGLRDKLMREREEQALAIQKAEEKRNAAHAALAEKSTMAEALRRMHEQQLRTAQLREGQPGPGERFAPQTVYGFTDPLSGASVPDTQVAPLTEGGMLAQLKRRKTAELETEFPFQVGLQRAKNEADLVVAPADFPEIGITKGSRVDKDTLAGAFRARGDTRSAEALEITARNSARAAQTAADVASRAAASGERQDRRAILNDATKIRTEFNTITKAARESKNMANIVLPRVQKLLNDPNGVLDNTLATQISKLLDPTSVVRESEFNRYTELGSLLDRAQAKWGSLTGGTKLSPAVRAQLAQEIGAISKAWDRVLTTAREDYGVIAGKYGIDDLELIFGRDRTAKPDPTTAGSGAPAAPKLPKGFTLVTPSKK